MHSLPRTPEPTTETPVDRAVVQTHRYLDELLSAYGPEHAHLRRPLRQLVTRGRRSPHELSLPLLVHAAVTGTPGPAVPVAAVHALWWRAANTFDDVADGGTGTGLYGMPGGTALTAALECGYALPLRALSAMPVPAPLRRSLRRDYLDGWTAASNGQIGDLRNAPDTVTPDSVLAVYRDKSGAVYAMACTMAARLATWQDDGDSRDVTEAWGRFGHLLGMLAQFRNDEDDLRADDSEDLRNGTACYLLVQLLHSAPDVRRRALALLERAPSSTESRRELRAMMLAPDVLGPCHEYLGRLVREATRLLDGLAPSCPFGSALRDRVTAEARHLAAPAVHEPVP